MNHKPSSIYDWFFEQLFQIPIITATTCLNIHPTIYSAFSFHLGFNLTIKFFSLLQSTLQTLAPWWVFQHFCSKPSTLHTNKRESWNIISCNYSRLAFVSCSTVDKLICQMNWLPATSGWTTSSPLRLYAAGSFEMAPTYQTAQYHVSSDWNINIHCRENFESHD